MAAGKYRETAIFERLATGARDRFGNPTGTGWAEVLQTPAWLRETLGKERIAAGRIEAPATATLRVQSSATGPARAITAQDRVQVRGQTWAIIGAAIDPDGRGRVLEFALERGGAET